jgi:hypothetical protein
MERSTLVRSRRRTPFRGVGPKCLRADDARGQLRATYSQVRASSRRVTLVWSASVPLNCRSDRSDGSALDGHDLPVANVGLSSLAPGASGQQLHRWHQRKPSCPFCQPSVESRETRRTRASRRVQGVREIEARVERVERRQDCVSILERDVFDARKSP